MLFICRRWVITFLLMLTANHFAVAATPDFFKPDPFNKSKNDLPKGTNCVVRIELYKTTGDIETIDLPYKTDSKSICAKKAEIHRINLDKKTVRKQVVNYQWR